MNVDTAQFEAITELADRQAGELQALREVASRFYETGYSDAGGPASARTAYRLGFAAGRRRATPEDLAVPDDSGTTQARHLRAVR